MTKPLGRRVAGIVAPAALVLGLVGCSSDSTVSKADFEEYLRPSFESEAQRSCITDRLFEDLDEEQITEGYEADGGDLPAEVSEAIAAAASACAGEG
jgi:uncharacterized lipoprotein